MFVEAAASHRERLRAGDIPPMALRDFSAHVDLVSGCIWHPGVSPNNDWALNISPSKALA